MGRLSLALAVFMLAATGAARAQDAGQIKTTRGAVHVQRDAQLLPASVGMKVRQSDTLVTGADGSVGVSFADNSLLSAGPNSVLAIDRYRFDGTTHAGQFDASLRKGTLAVISGKLVKQSPDAMRIHTPASVMAVRGTEFVVSVEEAGR